MRLCRALALEATGRPGEALDLYLAIEEQIRPASDPALQIAVARSQARLGRAAEARRTLEAIDPESVRNPRSQSEIREVRRLIRAAERRRPAPGAVR